MNEIKSEYAKALFEIALDEKSVKDYLECLIVIKETLNENKEYITLLYSPVVSLTKRLFLIDSAFKGNVPEHILSFLKLLCENGHIGHITDIIDEFESLERAISNIQTVKIYSVRELDDTQKTALIKKLTAKYSKNIDPVYIIDKTLVGAIKIEVDEEITDGSIRTRMKKLKDVIAK